MSSGNNTASKGACTQAQFTPKGDGNVPPPRQPRRNPLSRSRPCPQKIVVRSHTGSDLARYIPELAQLRIRVFRDFPYLYEGDLDYERRYLETYTRSPGSVIVLVFDGNDIVGASTGLPLSDETTTSLHRSSSRATTLRRSSISASPCCCRTTAAGA